jgi:hypothetical protein
MQDRNDSSWVWVYNTSGDSLENEDAQSREPAQARTKRSACLRTDLAAADRAQRVSGRVVYWC